MVSSAKISIRGDKERLMDEGGGGDYVSFCSWAQHKGFYCDESFTDSLKRIDYSDRFANADEDAFIWASAENLLRGECCAFAVALRDVMGYSPYLIEEENGKGFHTFCQVYKAGKCYYVDARGVTASFDEFMAVATEFVAGEYTVRRVTPDIVEEWEREDEYYEQAYAFAKAVINDYEGHYRV